MKFESTNSSQMKGPKSYLVKMLPSMIFAVFLATASANVAQVQPVKVRLNEKNGQLFEKILDVASASKSSSSSNSQATNAELQQQSQVPVPAALLPNNFVGSLLAHLNQQMNNNNNGQGKFSSFNSEFSKQKQPSVNVLGCGEVSCFTSDLISNKRNFKDNFSNGQRNNNGLSRASSSKIKSNWWPIFKVRDPMTEMDHRLNGQDVKDRYPFMVRSGRANLPDNIDVLALIASGDDLIAPAKLSKPSFLVQEMADGEIRSVLPGHPGGMNEMTSTDAASYVTSKRTGIDPLLLVSIGK